LFFSKRYSLADLLESDSEFADNILDVRLNFVSMVCKLAKWVCSGTCNFRSSNELRRCAVQYVAAMCAAIKQVTPWQSSRA